MDLPSLKQILISDQSPWESELVEVSKELICHCGCWWDWDHHQPNPLGACNRSQWAVGECSKCEKKYLG